jgi:hypothetical protein
MPPSAIPFVGSLLPTGRLTLNWRLQHFTPVDGRGGLSTHGHGEEGGETELVPLPAGILPSLPPLLVPRDDSEKPIKNAQEWADSRQRIPGLGPRAMHWMVGVDCRISERIKERMETEFRNARG